MSDRKNRPMDPESILSTLEYISQAIDAMTAVVGELREYLDAHTDYVNGSSVTLEPEGGSPLDRPTGPVLFIGRAVQLTT